MAETPRKVVLAVDASSVSKDAVEWATKQLLRPGDQVHFLSVLEPLARSDYAGSSEGSVAIGEGSQVRRRSPIADRPRIAVVRAAPTRDRDRGTANANRPLTPPSPSPPSASSAQCQPDPLALERTQKAIKSYTELVEARGVRLGRRRGWESRGRGLAGRKPARRGGERRWA